MPHPSPVAGASSRAQFDLVLPGHIARAELVRRPVVLMLLEVEAASTLLARVGREAFDAGIDALAAWLRSRLRRVDALFTYDEARLVAILDEAGGYQAAGDLAGRLLAQLEGRRFDALGVPTVSLGVAEHCPPETPADWLRRLEMAVLAAKACDGHRLIVDRHSLHAAWEGRPARPESTLAWHEAYECGEPVIDVEHRDLIETAAGLLRLWAAGERPPLPQFESLLAAVAEHFEHEEAILARIGYPALEQHRREHRALLQRAGRLLVRARAGEIGPGELAEYVAQDIVARHMLLADRGYVPFLRRA